MRFFILLVAFLTIFLSCKDKDISIKKQEKAIVSTIFKEPKNEVVLILKDSIESLFMNIRTSSHQVMPDIMVMGSKHKNNMLIVPTDSTLDIGIVKTHIYVASGAFMKGDTVQINLKESYTNKEPIRYPYYSLTNRDINLYELNFDYYVSLKTPTAKTFSRYEMTSRMKQWKNPATLDGVCKNIVFTVDSLYKRNLLSKDFRSEKIMEANVLKASSHLGKAFVEKTTINVDSLLTSLQNVTYVENDFLHNSILGALNYKYFFNRKKYAKSSELYDVIRTKDTLLKPEFKSAILDRLLTRIYASERPLFNGYLDKFRVDIPNSSKYMNKYSKLLAEEESDKKNNAILKNSTGKLLASKNKNTFNFNDILKKEEGKVILVDFWASWCAPCRMEMPAIKSLEQEIDTAKFAIFSISIDKSMVLWEKASKQEGIDQKTHNYLLMDTDNSKLIKDFRIKTIPRYVLFDKKGELIDANAPRPSDLGFKTILNNLLKQ